MTRFLLAALASLSLTLTAAAQPESVKLPARKLESAAPASPAPALLKIDATPTKGYVSPAAGAVTVRVQVTPNQADTGTGAVVWSEAGRSLVVTNRHVIESALSDPSRPVSVTVNTTGKAHAGSVLLVSHDGDVALVEVEAELPAVALGVDAIPGTPTTHYGNTTGPQRGTVTGYETLSASTWSGSVMSGTHHGASGDSGAGIYNDRGELVAVLWGGHPGRIRAVPVAVVRGLLARTAARFPRLSACLAARAEPVEVVEAEAQPTTQPAVKGGPVPKLGTTPAPTAPAPTPKVQLWTIDGGKTYHTEAEIRRLSPASRFRYDLVSGYTGPAVSFPVSPCANGNCPAPTVTYRRR